MKMKLVFLGAARNVTGSSYLLEANGKRILVDCGLYQEREFRSRNWDSFPVPADSIDAVLLTHAHLDHCGRLPKLVKEGFKGKIFSTPATADIARIILLDSAKIQAEDAYHKMKRHKKEGRKGKYPAEPLYWEKDVHQTLSLFERVDYEQPIELGQGINATLHDAGHILGSNSIRLRVQGDGEERSILFSGDVGRWDIPILKDPAPVEDADYILIESTYGDRVHGKIDDISVELAEIINRANKQGGNVLIPSFAVERTQELLYYLDDLLREKKVPHLVAFVDSPMAIKVTDVFKQHSNLFDMESAALIKSGDHPCDFPGLTMSRSVRQSKGINQIRGTAIIIAGSGMCTGGRIKHHLINNISRPESTILFVGYQAKGTLGRHISGGAKEVRIHGRNHKVEASIEKISGFSAHADKNELFKWLSPIKKDPKKVFVVHGEEKVATHFAGLLRKEKEWDTEVPEYRQEVVLD
jgi:metallo-beta-lactamase family protein